MKQIKTYKSPELMVATMELDGTILSQSSATNPNLGINDLTYENIEWN